MVGEVTSSTASSVLLGFKILELSLQKTLFWTQSHNIIICLHSEVTGQEKQKDNDKDKESWATSDECPLVYLQVSYQLCSSMLLFSPFPFNFSMHVNV